LDDLGFGPERNPKKLKKKEKDRKDALASIIDGTERRPQGPKQAEKQVLHYSGKKKIHSGTILCLRLPRKNETPFLS
jgi:hypothetical protein